ncbi:MAG: ABC transporter substrate-binding protein [Rhizobiaceae bacterium]|nr:ABC transporter substrate-binding protein [Rhizobiaceae bacterium]
MHCRTRLAATVVITSVLLAGCGSALAAGRASRVVSMNLCTDQLAMLIAAPGQLHSVSWLAADGEASAMAEQAKGFALNHGLAEEIFLMRPDLVIAGTYTTRATVGLLRELGIRVEEFPPENTLDDIRHNILRMGEVLGESARAAEVLGAFDHAVAEASAQPSGKIAATYFANSYTAGSGTLFDSLLAASGLENMAVRLGYAGTARLPLELLLLGAPDVLVDADERPSMPALAQQNFVHPAYRRLAGQSTRAVVPAKYTICGGPFTAEAIRLLREAGARAGANP